jgi:hypothetical protein
VQTIWKFGRLAVTGEKIDFADPAETGPAVRERGLRIELRVVRASGAGSIYASDGWAATPAICRIDLLESRPGAADRMHWHPVMTDGEPGDRTFDHEISGDPSAWVRSRLCDVESLLRGAGITGDFHPDAEELRHEVDAVVTWVEQSLAQTRRPWPEVTHDERGLAPVP